MSAYFRQCNIREDICLISRPTIIPPGLCGGAIRAARFAPIRLPTGSFEIQTSLSATRQELATRGCFFLVARAPQEADREV